MEYTLAFGNEDRTVKRSGEKELKEILEEINGLIE